MRSAIIGLAAIALAGCNGASGLANFEEAAKIVQKGQEIQAEAADKLAIGFDGYCNNVPTVARDYVRSQVNARLVKRGSKWRVAVFCIAAE